MPLPLFPMNVSRLYIGSAMSGVSSLWPLQYFLTIKWVEVYTLLCGAFSMSGWCGSIYILRNISQKELPPLILWKREYCEEGFWLYLGSHAVCVTGLMMSSCFLRLICNILPYIIDHARLLICLDSFRFAWCQRISSMRFNLTGSSLSAIVYTFYLPISAFRFTGSWILSHCTAQCPFCVAIMIVMMKFLLVSRYGWWFIHISAVMTCSYRSFKYRQHADCSKPRR